MYGPFLIDRDIVRFSQVTATGDGGGTFAHAVAFRLSITSWPCRDGAHAR